MRLPARRTLLVALTSAVLIGLPAERAEARAPANSARAASAPKSGTRPSLARASKQNLLGRKETVAQATVTIPAKSCAGFVAEEQTWVVTAAHCIPEGRQRFDVKLRDGTLLQANLEYLDRDRDLAALRLDQPAPVQPLLLAERLPGAGTQVLFVGRGDRRTRPQVATIERIDHCPSLPGVSNALFTTLEARPGDSGAPVVDRDLRVIGVIHGGARCHISAPTAGLARELHALGSAPAQAAAKSPPASGAHTGPAADGPVSRRYKAGPFVFERVPNGFRFRFSFRWGSED